MTTILKLFHKVEIEGKYIKFIKSELLWYLNHIDNKDNYRTIFLMNKDRKFKKQLEN